MKFDKSGWSMVNYDEVGCCRMKLEWSRIKWDDVCELWWIKIKYDKLVWSQIN